MFQPFLKKFVLVFFYDIMVYSSSLKNHVQHLEVVLKLLEENQLYAKKSKCTFATQFVEYLGHLISDKGVSMDPSKTTRIMEWPIPDSIKTLRGFLGLSGYYGRFIRNYGMITRPLTDLLKEGCFQWSAQATETFNNLKRALCEAPVLAMPDFSFPFVVETDACATSMGAVLMQLGKPISYLSKSFN